jgi:hypothetical protein
MRVSAFTPVPDAADPRVSVRRLGAFNEIGPDVSVIEAESGTTLPGSIDGQTIVRFLLEGSVRYDGRAFSGLSAFFFPSDEPYPPTVADSRCTFFQVGFGPRR